MINLPFYKVLKLDIPTHIKYWIIKNKQIPKHLLEIIDQTPPITLENTLELPLENFKIHGRTTQNQLSGSNLFDKSSVTTGYRIVWTTGLPYADATAIMTDFIEIETNTSYIYSTPAVVVGYDENKEYMGCLGANGFEKQQGTKISTFNISDTQIKFVKLLDYGSGVAMDIDTFQVNKGTTLLPYEEYCGGQASPNPEFPQPIKNVSGDITISVTDENNINSQEVEFPLAENQKLMEGDYLADDGIHHVRNQITLNGTENWAGYTDLGTTARVYLLYDGIKKGGNIFCNKLFEIKNFEEDKEGIGIYPYQTSLFYIKVNKSRLATENLAGVKSWLTSNNLLVEYEIAEETLETFTEAQATKFEEIKTLTGYNNITIVDALSSNLAPNVSLKYYAKGWR